MDIKIFTLLKLQAISAFGLLLATREFAIGKGLKNDIVQIDSYIEENMHMIALVNDQLLELEQTGSICRIGCFETINTL